MKKSKFVMERLPCVLCQSYASGLPRSRQLILPRIYTFITAVQQRSLGGVLPRNLGGGLRPPLETLTEGPE